MIKAIRNSKEEGYVAVDDFTLEINDDCAIYPPDAKPTEPPPTTTVEPPNECSFQYGLCNWELYKGTFFFNRTTGSLMSQESIDGPPADHTENSDSESMEHESMT